MSHSHRIPQSKPLFFPYMGNTDLYLLTADALTLLNLF